MSFEPFRSIVLKTPEKSPEPNRAPARSAPAARAAHGNAPAGDGATTIVERPSIDPESAGAGERPEDLHATPRGREVDEIVRPPSTVVSKEWVFAQTEADVRSALGPEGSEPRETTISPAKLPVKNPLMHAPIEAREETIGTTPDLHMAPLPASEVREETRGSVPDLNPVGRARSVAVPRSARGADDESPPLVVAYDGCLVGTYRRDGEASIGGPEMVYREVANHLATQIEDFDPEKIELFHLLAIHR